MKRTTRIDTIQDDIVSTTAATIADLQAGNANWKVAWETPVSHRGTPTWEMALAFPHQGEWTEEEYLNLDTNRLVEFTDGVLEFLPMPKLSHARISRYLSDLLRQYVEARKLGETLWAPVSVRLRTGKLREPDVLFLKKGRQVTCDVPDGADLVMEIVSGSDNDRRRDYEQKRTEYAESGIPEYWIIDPETLKITVLVLVKDTYRLHGEFHSGAIATSELLPEFTVNVNEAFAAAQANED